jgi:CzcA family heavy metal efflux pump
VTKFAIEHRIAVLVLVFGLVVAGFVAYATLPREASPDIAFPNIIVTVPYFGVSPNDIETLITNPLERELSDVKDLDEMTSTSAEGASIINLQFLPNVEISEALQRVRDKVSKVKPELPPDAEEPMISEISFSDFPIIVVSISGEYGLFKLKQVADDVAEKIEAIPGVSNAEVNGGLEREIQVNVNPLLLQHYGLSLDDIVLAVQNEHVNIPGGSVETGALNFLVRVPAEFSSARALADAVVKSVEGEPIRLRQVATVTDGFEDVTTRSRMRQLPAVSVSVMKRVGGNIIDIVDQIKAISAEMLPSLPQGTKIEFLADQSIDIRNMQRELDNNILSGLVLVLGVLLIFLGLRNALFVAVAIPLSMLIAFLVLAAMGITLNMVVLFSLILALGMLVDNGIVVVENVYRHAEMGKTPTQAALDGTQEVAWPIISSTFTTLAAFGPLVGWPGIMGEFMSYLPITVIIVLSASLFVALVVNPVLCAVFLANKGFENPQQTWFIRLYKATLSWSLRWRWVTVILAFGSLIGTFAAFGALNAGVEFFPDVTPRKIFVAVEAPDGTRLDATDETVRRIEQILGPLSNVKNYVADVGTGGGEMDFSTSATPNKARLTVDFFEGKETTEHPLQTIETIRTGILARTAGAEVEIKKEDMGPPAGPPINVEIAGEDYAVLGRHAETVKRLIRDIPGVTDIRDDYTSGRPEIRVRPDRATASALGIASTQVIANTVRTAVHGAVAAKLRELDDEYDIRVRLQERFRNSVSLLSSVEVPGDEGIRIPLRLVSEIDTASGTGAIRHKEQKRVITVGANVEGRNANEALEDVKKLLAQQRFDGAVLNFTGENKEQQEAASFLTRALGVALGLIALILVTQFNSIAQTGIILSSVILSLIGVLWGLIITQTPFGIMMTGIGVISLAGVAVNNAIVLIDYANVLVRGGTPLFEAVVQAGATRLRPVLLTTITTVLGLIPMAIGVSFDFFTGEWQVGGQSAEWWSPMAIAVSYGLAVATVLTLIVVPTFYYLLARTQEFWGRILERRRWLRVLVFSTLGVGALLFATQLIMALIQISRSA